MKRVEAFGLFFAGLLVFAGTVILLPGCQRPGSAESNGASGPNFSGSTGDKAAEENSANMSDPVKADASPSEVAKVALQFIQAGDKEGLLQLVAVKKVRADIQNITGGRNVAGMAEKAVPMAVSAIAMEINWLEKEGREIGEVSIQGDTATVTVKGMIQGKPQTRRFFLVREDDRWKLVPSHR